MNIDINGVKITLTKEQLAQIANQTKVKYAHYTDIKTLENALDYLDLTNNLNTICKLSTIDKIQIIARAINKLNTIKPKYNWFPVFNSASLGWSFGVTDAWGSVADGSVAYYKCEKSCKYAGNQFSDLYQQLHKETSILKD